MSLFVAKKGLGRDCRVCVFCAREGCRGAVRSTPEELEVRRVVQGLCAGCVCSETGEVRLLFMQAAIDEVGVLHRPVPISHAWFLT